MILKYIDGYYFLISLCVGIFLVYILSYQPQIIMRFPTPDNENTTIYKDKNEVCYKYKSEEVNCSIGSKDINLQTNDTESISDKIVRKLRF
jgi:hypothetical protein